MQPIQKISIPETCHQEWNEMTPVANGRHCSSCCKTVTDFTTMDNADIIKYLSGRSNICGRFDKERLDALNNQLENQYAIRFSWKKFAVAAAFSGLFTAVKAEAFVSQDTVQTSLTSKKTTGLIARDTITYKTVKGVVVSDDDNFPLPGVFVRVKNSTIGTNTNINGQFCIEVPTTADSLVIEFIGFTRSEVRTDYFEKTECAAIKLKSSANGVVAISRVPFYKTLWYKLKRVF